MGDRRWRICYGALRFAAVLAAWAVVGPTGTTLRELAARVRGRGDDGVGPFARSLPMLAQWLGPAFVKFAQLASTRPDVLPPSWCRAMASLREDGRPLPGRYVRRHLAAHGLGTEGVRLIGAGSVACVYAVPEAPHAVRSADPAREAEASLVAVKVLRPGVRAAIARDLELLMWGVRVMARLPRLRHLPLVDMVEHIAGAIAGQVNLVREKANLDTLHARLDPARVLVPAPRPGGSVDVLVMDYVPEFGTRGQPGVSRAGREQAARSLVDAVFRMLFAVGVVHCDLHPGNLRVAADGRVCIVDAGFVVSTDERLRRQFCEFFLALSLGNGPRCASTILNAAVSPPAALDRAAFEAEVSDIVYRYTGLAAADFSIVGLVDELFALQRRYRMFVSAAFVVPILALLVIEGTVRSWDPGLDFQDIAQPIILTA